MSFQCVFQNSVHVWEILDIVAEPHNTIWKNWNSDSDGAGLSHAPPIHLCTSPSIHLSFNPPHRLLLIQSLNLLITMCTRSMSANNESFMNLKQGQGVYVRPLNCIFLYGSSKVFLYRTKLQICELSSNIGTVIAQYVQDLYPQMLRVS